VGAAMGDEADDAPAGGGVVEHAGVDDRGLDGAVGARRRDDDQAVIQRDEVLERGEIGHSTSLPKPPYAATMTVIESAWGRYPGYRIDLVPVRATAKVWHGDVLLAESRNAVRLEETKHVDRLYFPESDVRWELFETAELHTVCPF